MRDPRLHSVLGALCTGLLACAEAEPPIAAGGGAAGFRSVEGHAVRDVRTGLEWQERDSGGDLSWSAALAYCRELSEGSGGPWRLPSVEELRGLHDPTAEQPCGGRSCEVDPAIDLTGPYHWSATARGERRRVYFDFANGSELSPQLRPTLTRRVLCVRG